MRLVSTEFARLAISNHTANQIRSPTDPPVPCTTEITVSVAWAMMKGISSVVAEIATAPTTTPRYSGHNRLAATRILPMLRTHVL